jgi:hypothetical protein
MTTGERLWKEGWIQGREEGLAAGRADGRAGDRASFLLRHLQLLLGPLPARAKARIRAADVTRSEKWVDAVVGSTPVVGLAEKPLTRDWRPEPEATWDDKVRQIQECLMIAADRIREEGRVPGRAIGYVEGFVEGLTETRAAALEPRQERCADLLRHVLERRFGALPAEIEATIRRGTRAEVFLWAENMLEALTLTDVFATD